MARTSPHIPVDRLVNEAQDRFIAAWGKMGGAWGISRTMAEVHALLMITGAPLCTDDVMERLQISRGNASMSLRALLDWGIVYRAHKRGDRKEYFEAERDVWAMFTTIARERKKREIDPVVASLYEIRDMTGEAGVSAALLKGDDAEMLKAHNARLDNLLTFIQAVEQMAGALTAIQSTQVESTIDHLTGSSGGAGGRGS
ncbi:MAG: GbsR/MarR family transcriptional regulator [Phycisphaerales bacterium]